MIAMREDLHDHPAASKVLSSVMRSIAHPMKAGFLKGLLDRTRHVQLRSPAGLFLGKAPAYDVDLGRLSKVIRRTAMGLFYDRYRKVLPPDYDCEAFGFDGVPATDIEGTSGMQDLISVAVRGEERSFGEAVFKCWHKVVDDDEFGSVWCFLIYERVGFLAITAKEIDIGNRKAAV